jgi:hypothetical protein
MSQKPVDDLYLRRLTRTHGNYIKREKEEYINCYSRAIKDKIEKKELQKWAEHCSDYQEQVE